MPTPVAVSPFSGPSGLQSATASLAGLGIAKVNGLLDKSEAPTAVSLSIEQAAPRDIAKAILRVMAQAMIDREKAEPKPATIDDHPEINAA